ncbi:hypothetical protein BGW39_009594 [Mortierella sp. 14UC]|nr:hypothetical protein BGW39_009594 [Mortierella sp. 14UC]
MAGTQTARIKPLFSPKRQQPRQAPSINSSTTDASKAPSQLALGIPEILEHILSYVSLKNRQDTAQLVCKQWQSICKGLAPVPFIWPLCLPDDENRTARGLVPLAHNLTIRVYQGKRANERLASWAAMMKTLSEMILERRQPKLRSLHLMEGVVTNLYMQLPELPTLPYLGTLRIDRETGWDIMNLFTIFAACPNLEELVVKPTLTTQYVTNIPSPSLEPNQEELLANGNQPPMARLRTCILYNLMITIPALKVFLESCPQLSELVLVNLYRFTCGGHMGIEIRNRGPIIDLVGTHCPTLKKLHLSASYDNLADTEVTSILEQFPALENYSFSDRDAGATLVKGLRTIVNRLTTLNLLATQRGYSSRQVTLRTILCTFEHLIHLRAPNMDYFHEDMDVNDIRGQMHARWNHSRGGLDHAMTDNPTEQYIWACRGLRTLHMSVGCRTSDSSSPSSALIMFGFLSRMCPQLQELHLRRRLLDLTFRGGLCLMTRLRELERIKIITAYDYPLDDHALFWMRLAPSTMDHFSHPLLQFKTKRELRNWYQRFPVLQTASSVGRKKMIDDGNRLGIDFTKVGTPEDLMEWMSERYGSRRLATWPKLQQFSIESSERRHDTELKKAEAFAAKVRPDAEFHFRHAPTEAYLTTLQLH